MGTEKNLQLGIYIIDIILLTIFIFGYYELTAWISPQFVSGIKSPLWVWWIYFSSFTISSIIYPPLAQGRLIKGVAVVKRVKVTCLIMLLTVAFIIVMLHPTDAFPRKFLISSIAIFCLLLLIERLIIRRILKHFRTNKKNQKKVVMIGNDLTVYELYRILSTPIYGYDIAGIFYDGDCNNPDVSRMRLGGSADIYGWLTKHPDVSEIYCYFPKEQHDAINMISKFCDNHLIRFYYIPAIDIFNGLMTFKMIEGIPLIARREEPLRKTSNKIAKRLFDILFSLAVLILVFPWVWIWVSIMIRIQSPGPIFFKQERTGLDGKVFTCIKFRSMKVNKDADKMQATKDDPRKFPFGDFMRKTNIDELPQFINVLKGDMSIVGPRPHMLKHTAEYSRLINRFMVRHFAKPGITGLAQVSGFRGETRYIDQMENRVKKDIEYIEHWSFLMDIRIIIKTVTNMLGNEKGNAY